VTIKGYFWRSSVRDTVKTALEQAWEPTCHTREVPVLPGGTSVLAENRPPDSRERTPRIVLSVVEREEYERDPSKLVAITTRVCIGLMRQGYEVRPDIYCQGTPIRRRVEQGPAVKAKFIETFDQMVREFGDPKKNGGPKK
jgi:hypothetical protein